MQTAFPVMLQHGGHRYLCDDQENLLSFNQALLAVAGHLGGSAKLTQHASSHVYVKTWCARPANMKTTTWRCTIVCDSRITTPRCILNSRHRSCVPGNHLDMRTAHGGKIKRTMGHKLPEWYVAKSHLKSEQPTPAAKKWYDSLATRTPTKQ